MRRLTLLLLILGIPHQVPEAFSQETVGDMELRHQKVKSDIETQILHTEIKMQTNIDQQCGLGMVSFEELKSAGSNLRALRNILAEKCNLLMPVEQTVFIEELNLIQDQGLDEVQDILDQRKK
jgi:hypothetical protein